VTFVAVAALVLAPTTAAAQDKPWRPKVHKPKRPQTPKPPPTKPPASEADKPAKSQPVVATPAAPAAAPQPALQAEAERRAQANPFPRSLPPPGPATQASGPAAPTLGTPAPVAPDKGAEPTLLERHRAALAPHGTWVEEDGIGDVWLPDPAAVGADFAPYRTDGHWALTDQDQWAWVSDFDWGKVPFHYGRWDWNAQRGWGWVPDAQWAPAKVLWRLGEPGFDFVGWAPVPPAQQEKQGPSRPTATTPVLPFWYVPSDKLFHPNLDDHVITDRKLGQSVHQHSTIFGQHLAQAGDLTKLTTASLQSLRPASPTPAAARIPDEAIPKTRLRLTKPDSDPEADAGQVRRDDKPRRRIQRGIPARTQGLRPLRRGGRIHLPKRRHRVIQNKQIRPRPRQRCRRWVRTWSGALRCTHR